MGINGFTKLLERYSQMHTMQIDDYRGQTISFDASIQIYKFRIGIMGHRGKNLTRRDGKITSHLHGLFTKTLMLLKYDIIPIWVFDGKPPDIKKPVLNERRQIRKKAEDRLSDPNLTEEERVRFLKRTVSITNDEIEDIKKMFELIGVPMIQSNRDAEAQCAANETAAICSATSTEDTDYFLFGGSTLVRNITKGEITEIRLEDILTDLSLTREQLIDVSILLGTDYCPSIKGLGSMKAYELYTKHGKDMNKLLEYIRSVNQSMVKKGLYPKYTIPSSFNDLYQQTKDYYIKTRVINPHKVDTEWHEPQYDNLKAFLLENEFKEEHIIQKLDSLKNAYIRYKNRDKHYKSSDWTVVRGS